MNTFAKALETLKLKYNYVAFLFMIIPQYLAQEFVTN
jgi:hypothetical protein